MRKWRFLFVIVIMLFQLCIVSSQLQYLDSSIDHNGGFKSEIYGRLSCGDFDGDRCDDCTITWKGNPYGDGPDIDNDGICDYSDKQNLEENKLELSTKNKKKFSSERNLIQIIKDFFSNLLGANFQSQDFEGFLSNLLTGETDGQIKSSQMLSDNGIILGAYGSSFAGESNTEKFNEQIEDGLNDFILKHLELRSPLTTNTYEKLDVISSKIEQYGSGDESYFVVFNFWSSANEIGWIKNVLDVYVPFVDSTNFMHETTPCITSDLWEKSVTSRFKEIAKLSKNDYPLIKGAIIDMEMYGTSDPKYASYLEPCYNPLVIEEFLQAREITDVNPDPISLKNNQLIDEYSSYYYNQLESYARDTYNQVYEENPNFIIGGMTLIRPDHETYNALARGLGTSEHPVYGFTELTYRYGYQPGIESWLNKISSKGIDAKIVVGLWNMEHHPEGLARHAYNAAINSIESEIKTIGWWLYSGQFYFEGGTCFPFNVMRQWTSFANSEIKKWEADNNYLSKLYGPNGFHLGCLDKTKFESNVQYVPYKTGSPVTDGFTIRRGSIFHFYAQEGEQISFTLRNIPTGNDPGFKGYWALLHPNASTITTGLFLPTETAEKIQVLAPSTGVYGLMVNPGYPNKFVFDEKSHPGGLIGMQKKGLYFIYPDGKSMYAQVPKNIEEVVIAMEGFGNDESGEWGDITITDMRFTNKPLFDEIVTGIPVSPILKLQPNPSGTVLEIKFNPYSGSEDFKIDIVSGALPFIAQDLQGLFKGFCVGKVDGTSCNDEIFCNGNDVCQEEICVNTVPINPCEDGISCTINTCIEGVGGDELCEISLDNTICDNNLFCDGVESCDPTVGCQSGIPPVCVDSVSCTHDSCNEGTDSCDYIPQNNLCDNNLFCDGVESCDPTVGCQSGIPPVCEDPFSETCTSAFCDVALNSCVINFDNTLCFSPAICDPSNFPGGNGCGIYSLCTGQVDGSPCNDGIFCNGNDVCQKEICVNSVPINPCEDGISCTTNTCLEGVSGGSCALSLNKEFCDDKIWCNGEEICDENLGCIDQQDPHDDSTSCTIDSCEEETQVIINTPNDNLCASNEVCIRKQGCSIEIPTTNKFDGNTTNFSSLSDLTKVSNAVIENTQFGRIDFLEDINVAGLDLDSYVTIENNLIEIDTINPGMSNLNVQTKLWFYGIDVSNGVLFRDGEECTNCVKMSYENGIFIVSVPGFSKYEIGELISTGGDPGSGSGENGGGSGGGGSLGGDFGLDTIPCITQWICNPWSDCINGTQIRTCSNSTNCNGDSDPPLESKECFLSSPIKLQNQTEFVPITKEKVVSFILVVGILSLLFVVVLIYYLIRNKKFHR